jgi:2,4-dienoyl-CoA reductase-like NADH-dependent reductase (Old Yellow Enzyme family)
VSPATTFTRLAEPFDVAGLRLPNRIVMPAMGTGLPEHDGTCNEATIAYYRRRAEGGVGMITIEASLVSPDAYGVGPELRLHGEEFVPGLRQLVDALRPSGIPVGIQLWHPGRQTLLGEPIAPSPIPLSSRTPVPHELTLEEIHTLVDYYALSAWVSQQAGFDFVEIHGAHCYLPCEFISPLSNRRTDEYGGPLENRARLLVETVEAIRREVGDDFHLQVKISATELGNALMPWAKKGNTIEDSVQVAKWLEAAGADAIHVSRGNTFPHPDNPAGTFSAKDVVATYDTMLSSGSKTFRNYVLFRTWPVYKVFEWRASRTTEQLEAASLDDARRIKEAVSIPVVVTGGFQRASLIRDAIERGSCDAVAIGRGLIANNDLVRMFAEGRDEAPRPCTYCNKCLYAVLESPLGCYDERRYDSREEMIAEIMSVFAKDPARVAA